MEEKELSLDGRKFVYNKMEKDYYVSKGIKMIDSGIHFKTKRQFWIFLWVDIETAFYEWKHKLNL